MHTVGGHTTSILSRGRRRRRSEGHGCGRKNVVVRATSTYTTRWSHCIGTFGFTEISSNSVFNFTRFFLNSKFHINSQPRSPTTKRRPWVWKKERRSRQSEQQVYNQMEPLYWKHALKSKDEFETFGFTEIRCCTASSFLTFVYVKRPFQKNTSHPVFLVQFHGISDVLKKF